MFKKIEIHFSHPICNCQEQSLTWQIFTDTANDNRPGLKVACITCGVQVIVPAPTLSPRVFVPLEHPYPGKKSEKKTEPKPEIDSETAKAVEEVKKKMMN